MTEIVVEKFEQEGGTEVAGGKHVVPAGVAVEPLSDWNPAKKLKSNCPEQVKALLERNFWSIRMTRWWMLFVTASPTIQLA